MAALVIACMMWGVAYADVDFYDHWADGRAELSSYDVIQPRYGQMRSGYGVMIFVTEDINRQTHIKVESEQPREDRLYVLKLNNVLKFTTGIYDYSVMTSVFSEVEGEEHPFALRKISLSAQEWCGHVFEEVRVREGRLYGYVNSYFEREGSGDYRLEKPRAFASEDGLLIRMRELKGEWLAAGQSIDLYLLPALWSLRASHVEHALVSARLHKGPIEQVALAEGPLAARIWRLEMEGGWKQYWVEEAYPHRILQWRHSDGGSGQLKKTIRVPYWSLNGNADSTYRRELGIP